MSRPLATNYLSTLEYIADYDAWAKKHRAGYSQRNFANWAKIKSPNFLSLVIAKKRALKGAWLDGFIRAAQLSPEEGRYLRKLSLFENARSNQERQRLLGEIQSELADRGLKSLAADQLEILMQPNAWAIYYMLDLVDQKATPLWFKQRLRFLEMTGVEVSAAIALLKRLGLVEEKNQKLLAKEKLLHSPDQVAREANALFHEHVLKEASLALQKLEPDERAFGSMTATVPKEKIEALKKEINTFGKYLTTKFASKDAVDGEVMRLNIQLYPLTEKRG